jgi:hypothetical protein|uniref:hypothetical protein n=1 Tax=Nonlabens sp. Ci31 TaxID=2608253 RepID=UPI001473418B|nr:hypothetical protein [Nonlabens sp. Ci31]
MNKNKLLAIIGVPVVFLLAYLGVKNFGMYFVFAIPILLFFFIGMKYLLSKSK